MGQKLLEAELSSSSLEKLIKALEFYNTYKDERLQKLVDKLKDLGLTVVNDKVLAAKSDDLSPEMVSIDFYWDQKQAGRVEGRIVITSEPIYSYRRTSQTFTYETTDEEGNPVQKTTHTMTRVFWPHLAFEFGAGNAYNGMQVANPYAKELGMGPGTFPMQTHVPNPGWWTMANNLGDPSYDPATGKPMYKGTQATMPMYSAWLEMSQKLAAVAREVFDGR